MNSEQKELQEQIKRATERLLATVRAFTEEDVRAASRLPGWTRGHVLTHLARGADALRSLMRGAQSGNPGTGYVSQAARDADIEAGSGREVAALLADIVRTDQQLWSQAEKLTDHAWTESVKILDYQPFPASQLLIRRLVEIELHHVDLGAGYDSSDWPAEFTERDLPEPMNSQRATR